MNAIQSKFGCSGFDFQCQRRCAAQLGLDGGAPPGPRCVSMRSFLSSLVVICAATLISAAPEVAAVNVWRGTVQIPTYSEGPANPNPPFDLFSYGRFNYPYPIRDNLTDT